MYKYLEMQEDIVEEPILEEFNTTFPVNYQINLEITIERNKSLFRPPGQFP